MPKFVQQSQQKQTNTAEKREPSSHKREQREARGPKYREPGVLGAPSAQNFPASQSAPNLAQIPQVQPFWWHSRLYPDASAGKYTDINLLKIVSARNDDNLTFGVT